MKRRNLLLAGSAFATLGIAGLGLRIGSSGEALAEEFEITKTPEEWRAILTDFEYRVLREEATERPYTSDLLKEKREGTFTCAGCDLPLYASSTKYDSGTGWPSFWEALPNAVGTKVDNKLFMTRTEVHCRRCGGHLGHIFDDGPEPTGKRHCINGVSLDFVAA
ncbi:peptide-methionine (R)-S-oxide reductase MsrB [Cucumibacter marinus]|uniref:peptide-methionine (R)-S-oxide reductase MsrB n=1 Tax=Cucumibacter marinus TaxID=1121252 RepID=UPI000429DC83|nr:peptide-methionine (R)-S-oxide reductase MsrB [Cucumibacter marinus]